MGAKTDKIFGRAKQALGAITGNETMKREGQRQEDKGKVKRTVDSSSRTKRTASRTRVIAAPEVTARELKAWRLESGRPGEEDPIVGVMSPNALRLWGAKRLRPAVAAATGGRIRDATVYTLRHSHASALHYAGFTPAEAAERMGHGLGLHWRTYAHVVKAMSGTRYDGDALISAARARLELRQSSVTAEGRD